MVATILLVLLIGSAIWVLINSRRTAQAVSARTSAQQTTTRAVVRLLTELQEGMEVLAPQSASTLSYALIRDKVSVVRWFFLVPSKSVPGTRELWRYRDDQSIPAEKRLEHILNGVQRLAFTATSEGSLQVNLVVAEEGHEFPLLTTVRLRNIASAEELY